MDKADKASDEGTSDEVRIQLGESDIGLIRVIEDLVDVLLRKGLITITDLPAEARDKLTLRRVLRSKMSDLGQLIEADEPEEGF